MEGLGELIGQLSGDLFVEALCRALRQPGPEGLDRTSDVVDQLGARADQRIPRVDQRQVSLGLCAAVLHWVEKLGVGPGKTGQLLGIKLIGLTLFAVDQPRLARIGYEYLVTALFE